MKNKIMRQMVMGLVLALLAIMPMTASAQDCPDGLGADDCAFLTAATANTANSQSFAFDFGMSAEIGAGFGSFGMSVSDGAGWVTMDGTGVITAARFDMPEASLDLGFFAQSGAASFILVDDVAYFGSGTTLDDLEWRSVTMEELGDPVFTFASFTDLGGFFNFDLVDDFDILEEATWSRLESPTSRAEQATLLSASVVDGDPFAAAQEELEDMGDFGDLFGGMFGLSGTLNGNTDVYIDSDSQRILEVRTLVNISLGTNDDETGDALGGLFGMMGIGGDLEFFVYFTEYDGAYDISAPAVSEPGNVTFSMRDAAMNDQLISMITEYFVDNAEDGMEDMFGGMFGGLGGDLDDGDFDMGALFGGLFGGMDGEDGDFDMDAFFGDMFGGDMGDMFGGDMFGFSFDDYTGRCETRPTATTNSINIGETVTGDLTSGEKDLWTFQGSAGQTVTIAQTSNIIDSYLELLDPSGAGIASNDDGGIGLDSLLQDFELPVDGTYTIVACSFWNTDSGQYELSLR